MLSSNDGCLGHYDAVIERIVDVPWPERAGCCNSPHAGLGAPRRAGCRV